MVDYQFVNFFNKKKKQTNSRIEEISQNNFMHYFSNKDNNKVLSLFFFLSLAIKHNNEILSLHMQIYKTSSNTSAQR